MQPLLDESRESLARVIGCEAADLVFVSNATAGVNSVLRSLRFRPGEQILVTDHGYNACRNVAVHVAERDGAEVVVAQLPLVVDESRQIVDAVLARVTERTRIALVDHVTEPHGTRVADRRAGARVKCSRHRYARRRRPCPA